MILNVVPSWKTDQATPESRLGGSDVGGYVMSTRKRRLLADVRLSLMALVLLASSSGCVLALEINKSAVAPASMPVAGMSEEIKTPYYTLHYSAKFKDDADKEARFLDQGIEALKSEFSTFPVDKLLKVQCDVFLYPEKTERVSDGNAYIIDGERNGVYAAGIHLITPSLCDPSWRSKVGEPPSDDTFFRLLMHEYSTILLDRISREKSKGPTFHHMPAWFVQGYEEYCGLMLTSATNRSDSLKKYLAAFRSNPDRVSFDFGLSTENDYIDGAMLLLFMNESFTKEKVQSILSSTEPSFGKAVVSSLGVDLAEFAKRWQAWLQQRLS